VLKASRSFIRAESVGSQAVMVKTGSEANIAGMSHAGGGMSSNHSGSAANLAMTTSTPSLPVTKSNNASGTAASTPTVTVTNLVAVITDVQTLVAQVSALLIIP